MNDAVADNLAERISLNNVVPPALTERQTQILQLIAEDLTAKQIAAKLGIASKTVEFHKDLLRRKTGSVGTAGLVRFAIRNGFVNP